MHIVIMGPPGCGKGTQAKRLKRRFNIPWISSGHILRQAIARKTLAGQEVETYLKAGTLVPDELMIRIIKERVSASDCKNGFVLDGFPRTLAQGQALLRVLKELGISKFQVIFITLPEDEILIRLGGRRTCKICGMMYHIKFAPPEDNKCRCGGGLLIREDDKEEVIKTRLKVYRRDTDPLREFFKEQGVLKEIEGSGKEEDVWKRICKAVEF
jgi:adenylate kinase